MAKKGRKTMYTPEELKAGVDEYFARCEEAGEFPDLAGMRLWLGVSERTLNRYRTGEGRKHEQYREILDRARDRRESFLVRKMTRDNKNVQGCLNALRQPSNGGYIDKPKDSGERTLIIKLAGVGGAEAFK